MSVEVKIDFNKYKSAMNSAKELVVSALAEQILADSTDFVPYSAGSRQSAGALRESGRVDKGQETGERYVTWDTVYALYQWFGVRADGTHVVKNYTTPNTGKEWVYMAEKVYGKEWNQLAQNIFSRSFK